MKVLTNYRHTIYACYLGYITQAIIVNFAPLLFLTFAAKFGLTLDKITVLTTLNFGVQLTADVLATKLIYKIGYRKTSFAAHFFAAAGLVGMAVLPSILASAYAGLLISVVMYAIGGGLIEVIISPIVEACPTDQKEGAMSLLHSFYCWGQVGVVLLSTVFFTCFGISNWRILSCIWAVIPLANILYFRVVPIYPIEKSDERMSVKDLFNQKAFWMLMIIMICSGAAEQAMAQWASTFAEKGLRVSKTVGDLAGPCTFAALMGVTRAFYGKNSEKIPLRKMMLGSAVLCVICYMIAVFSKNHVMGLVGCALCGLAVGIFWPGTISMAAAKLPSAGTALFAMMALAGDTGCTMGPTLVGLTANAGGGELKTGLAAAMIFPVLIFIGIAVMKNNDV